MYIQYIYCIYTDGFNESDTRISSRDGTKSFANSFATIGF